MSLFSLKTLLITGGTGSFGHAVLDRFLETDIEEIRILSAMKKSRMICGMLINWHIRTVQIKSNFT